MKIAAIDVGSNSIHLVVVEVDGTGSQTLLARDKAMVQLGRGLGHDGLISPEAFAAGLDALRRMKDLLRAQDCQAVAAFGTATLRDARNAQDFVAAAAGLGVPIRVISGEEEARLIYLAVSQAVPFPDEPVVLLDIGGGSTEMTWHAGGRLVASTSIPWGTQRLADAFPTGDPPSGEQLRKLRAQIQKILRRAARGLPKDLPGPTMILGTSGTLEALAKGATGEGGFTREQLKAFHTGLWREDAAGRIARLGVEPRRGETLHVGATWTLELMKWLGSAPLRHLGVGLREGMVWEALRHGGSHLPPLADLRRASVEALAAKSDLDPGHSRHVQVLARSLFEDLRHAFELGDQEGELLAHASRLHDIGFSISEKSHHKHGAYIVRNSRLQGFWPEEVDMISLLVRHHRGRMPDPTRHDGLALLDPWRRRSVEKLSALLRVADALDRRRTQAVRTVRAVLEDRQVVLVVSGPGDLSEEREAVDRKGRLLQELLGRRIGWVQGDGG